jgi:phosphatidylglycerol lysyltransferase
VIIIAVPAVVLSFKTNHTDGASFLYGLMILTAVMLVIVLLAYLVIYKNFGAGTISKFWPGFLISLDNLRYHSLSFNQFLMVIVISILIEVVGVFQIYISLAALGMPISIAAALTGYVLMTIFLILSPFLRGLGAIEVSLTLLLTHYGLTTIQATSGMLLFRFFEFWLPLGFGLITFLFRPGKTLLGIFPTALLFLLGLINILSAITPAIPTRARFFSGTLCIKGMVLSTLLKNTPDTAPIKSEGANMPPTPPLPPVTAIATTLKTKINNRKIISHAIFEKLPNSSSFTNPSALLLIKRCINS